MLDIEGSVVSQNDNSKLVGAKITIFKNGSRSNQVTTDSRGKFSLSLPPDANYILEFSNPGYVNKKISFNTKNVPPELGEGGNFLFRFDMTLFKEMEGLDVSILDKPLAEVMFDPNSTYFDYDKEYTKTIKQRIEKLQEDLEAQLAAEEAVAKENEAKYKSAMSEGQKAMSKGDFASAKANFAAALAVKPEDQSAKSSLEDAQKNYEKLQAERNKEKAYTEAIENAEMALHEGNYKEAETEFQRAFDLKPGDVYARDQIKEIRDLMANAAKAEQNYIVAIGKADAAMQQQDYLTAKSEYLKAKEAKPNEQYPKDQLEEVESFLVADAQKESDYIKAIERGETGVENNDLQSAQAAFQQASEIKPDEKYPKDQLAKIKSMMAEIELANKNYDAAIKKADEAFNNNNFEVAGSAYKEALDIKPDQQYPKDQIAAIAAKQEEQKLQEQRYAELIKGADQRYETHDMIAAKAEYQKALEIKPNEAHPKQRIEEISTLLEKEAKIEEQYKAAIANADGAFNANDYTSAKFEYQAALKLKPEEAYPKEQLAKCEEFLAQVAKKEEEYNNAIKQGDENFNAGTYEAARESYTVASGLKPDEKYPKDQLSKIEQKLIELQNLNKEYDAAIASGDEAFNTDALEKAKTSYQKAVELKPEAQYPKDKLAEITNLLAKAKEQEEKYTEFISNGDAAMSSKEYENAKTAYNKALELKPNEQYPKDKLAEIESVQSELAANKQKYDELIAKADEAFNGGQLEAALPVYKEAAGIMESESYPVEQITLIENKLIELKQLDEQYQAAITSAESTEEANDLQTALTEFKKASALKPDESYPKEKIAEISEKVKASEEREAAYNDAIALADEAKANKEYDIAITSYKKAAELKPNEAYPGNQVTECETLKAEALAAIELANRKEEEYKSLIAEADALFDAEDYAAARTKYQSALGIKPDETHPKERIGKIDGLLANLEEQKAIDEQYNNIIAEADQAFDQQSWETARSKYREAQNVKPNEAYPAEKLKAIEEAIAAVEALADKEAREAAQKEKDEKYNVAIATADQAFESKDWENAKAAYKEAQGIKPEETYPASQLKAIDEAIAAAEALAEKEAKEAAQNERDEKYVSAISRADDAFQLENWTEAKSAYQEAIGIKPEETYPSEQIKLIDENLAAMEAQAEKNARAAAEAEKDEKYKAAIASADEAFKAKNWEVARSKYKEGLEVKPAETYPANQLKAIDEAIAAAEALAAKEANAAMQKEKEEKYSAAIKAADKAFKSKEWENARTNYQAAIGVKPEEIYPADQLKAIDKAIAAAKEMDAIAEREEKYKSLIAQADKSFEDKQWENSKATYQEALTIKPEESYPKDRIAAINEEMTSMKKEAKRDEYDAYISTADQAFKKKDYESARTNYNSALSVMPDETYPKDQLKRIDEAEAKADAIALKNQKDENYRQLIGDADQLFNAKDLRASKSKYQEALGIKPDEEHPKQRISEIEELLQAEASDLAALNEKFDKMIKRGDDAFNGERYSEAKDAYNGALEIKDDPYPKRKLDEINDILGKKALAKTQRENQKAEDQARFDEFVRLGDNDFRSKNYKSARSNYEAALDIKPGDPYPKNKIRKIDELMQKPDQQIVAASPEPKKSTGMSEEEIAAMMAKWQNERAQAKVDQMNQRKDDLKEASDERVSGSEERILTANDDLNELETILAESNKAGRDRNLNEAAMIEEVRTDQQHFMEDKGDQSKTVREKNYADLEINQKGQREIREKGTELYQVNTELMNTKKIQLSQVERERIERGKDRIQLAKEGINEIEENQREESKSHMEDYMANVEDIQKKNELIATTERTRQDESREIRQEKYEDINQLEQSLSEFSQENKESYMNNTEKYWEQTQDLQEYMSQKKTQESENRQRKYGEIEDYTADVKETQQERHNSYNERNAEIVEQHLAITDYTAQLTANADERRMNYDPDFYTGEEKPRYPELAREHPQGVTEETYQENEAYVIKRIVVEGDDYNEYLKIYYKWGGIYYKKNGEPITETIWNSETQ